MADEPNPTVVETPPPETPQVPAVDEGGVPYLNRFKEQERKAMEAEARATAAEQMNERYMAALGNARGNPQPTPAAAPSNPMERIAQHLSVYQPQDRNALVGAIQEAINIAVADADKRTEAYSYKLLTRMSHQQQLQDPELMQEAQKAYQVISQNPMWAGAADELKQDRAIAEARAVLAVKKGVQPNPSGGPQTLPGTSPQRTTPQVPDREKFIQQFVGSEENRSVYRHMTRKDPDSAEGKKAMREAAEIEFQASLKPMGHFGPESTVGKAAQAILKNAERIGQ